jgi:hypothetical protein
MDNRPKEDTGEELNHVGAPGGQPMDNVFSEDDDKMNDYEFESVPKIKKDLDLCVYTCNMAAIDLKNKENDKAIELLESVLELYRGYNTHCKLIARM